MIAARKARPKMEQLAIRVTRHFKSQLRNEAERLTRKTGERHTMGDLVVLAVWEKYGISECQEDDR